MATNHSLPSVSGSWAYDSHYPDQLGHVALTLTGAMTGTYEADTASGVTAAALDLPMPTQAGTVNWTYAVTDMFGNTSSATGSFAVVAYSPPAIAACSFERYKTVQTDTGDEDVAADDGEFIWMTLDANIAAVNSRNAWTATLTAWRKERTEITPAKGSAVYEDTSGVLRTVSVWALGGSDGRHVELDRDDDNLAKEMALSAAYDWSLRLTIEDALGNTVTLLVDDDIQKADALLDLGPYGKRSTGSAGGGEKFECAWPAHLLGGIPSVGGGALCASSRLALGFQTGGGNYGSTWSAGYKDVAFTFPTPFKAGTVPHVVVGLACQNITNSNAGGVAAYVLLETITNTGFSVRIINRSSQSLNPAVSWVAIGEMEG